MGRRVQGSCRICGAVGPLSWEHVPPESAFNDARVFKATRDQLLSATPWDGTRGKIQQRGCGAYTLCERCNNNTGAWYGSEFAAWAKQGAEYLGVLPPTSTEPITLAFYGRPLRFLKQVVTMFFSVNDERFAAKHPALERFVRDRNTRELPPWYRIDLLLVRGGFFRSCGTGGLVDLTSGATQVRSEIAHFPFAQQLVFDDVARPTRPGPIEWFTNFGPDEHARVSIRTVVGHVATKFPFDYRSAERVAADRDV